MHSPYTLPNISVGVFRIEEEKRGKIKEEYKRDHSYDKNTITHGLNPQSIHEIQGPNATKGKDTKSKFFPILVGQRS